MMPAKLSPPSIVAPVHGVSQSSKRSRVVCYERQIVKQSDGGDHHIRCRNGNSLLKQAATHLAKLLRTRMVEIQHLNIAEQVGDLLEQRPGIADVVSPGIEFSQNNGGNEQPTAVLDETMSQPTRTAKMSRTVVGIQK